MKIILDGDERDYLVYRQGSGPTIEIFDIAVGSERRKGKGRALINLLIDEYLPTGTNLVWAITRADNRIAQLFYEELGFRIVGNLFGFYRDDQHLRGSIDAVMYGRNIRS